MESDNRGYSNQVASNVSLVGWIILIFGIIGSFVLGFVFKSISISYSGYERESYNWVLMLQGICTSIAGGLFFIGFSELIEINHRKLNSINKIKKMFEEKESSANSSDSSNT